MTNNSKTTPPVIERSFQGQKVLVTGGNRGIGEAIAKKFATMGADVVITYAHDKAKAANTVNNIIKHNVKAQAIKFNLSKLEDIEDVVQQATKFLGKINILINNAVMTPPLRNFLNTSDELLLDEIKTNLIGTMSITRTVCKRMIAQNKGGNIVNISSTAAINTLTDSVMMMYGITKAGITRFTKGLAIETAQYGIRANSISPGAIATDFAKDFSEEAKENFLKLVPLTKFGSPENIAHIVVAVVLNEYMTGENIVIDGGLSLSPLSPEAFIKARKFWGK